MFQIKNFVPRDYQKNIMQSCLRRNTLVVVPTGLGKTKIAILVAVEMINKGKILFLTPTRPLASQIQKEFLDYTNIENVELVTGTILPVKRKEFYKKALVIISTPQTIENDIKNNLINLNDFSLLVVDETHRAVKKFAYTFVAEEYRKIKTDGRLIGLTASPGSDRSVIDEIKKHLGVINVEIRTETDSDVKEYVQEKKIENIKVDLPIYFLEVVNYLKSAYKRRLENLEAFGYKKSVRYIRKLDILTFQKYLHKQINQGNKFAYSGVSLTAALLKLSHALELLETQGLKASYVFLENLKSDQTKAASSLLNDQSIIKAMNIMKNLDINHPKVDSLKEVVINQLKESPNSRVIVFAKFRATTKMICEVLSVSSGIKPVELIGQKEGLKQSEQIQRIKEFGEGKYNCLITTNIGEEGLDIASADLAIFYDQTGTSIRKIQRAGRVGRLTPGKIVNLITRGTRDESTYYAARADEKKMKSTLQSMQRDINLGNFDG